ncbi:adenylyl-sulfate kinase (plasmid) [Deinococcus aetherius]|uniref:Adenylyl-sulfate kinase n=1 Tax=Deinococcus aetherius TaxID=200252 RepID=A0ABM8AJH0_9DEIO|nr:AAA family ATPase [Deinococcus aetherius]BDP43970.1 adenylyl-sulfate kinase [Deinococcus aetherius]
MTPVLIVFSGLPGTGKSTLAQQLARRWRAAYLRVDSVEAALLNAGHVGVTVEGYAVEYVVAEDNLHLGLSVVADCVNPVHETRGAWAEIARRTGSDLIDLEVICSNESEHRRRVETRRADPGHHIGRWSPPGWPEIERYRQAYEPWETPPLVLDTAQGTQQDNFAALLALLGARG